MKSKAPSLPFLLYSSRSHWEGGLCPCQLVIDPTQPASLSPLHIEMLLTRKEQKTGLPPQLLLNQSVPNRTAQPQWKNRFFLLPSLFSPHDMFMHMLFRKYLRARVRRAHSFFLLLIRPLLSLSSLLAKLVSDKGPPPVPFCPSTLSWE